MLHKSVRERTGPEHTDAAETGKQQAGSHRFASSYYRLVTDSHLFRFKPSSLFLGTVKFKQFGVVMDLESQYSHFLNTYCL